MTTIFQELETYKNFDELARDVLDLAKEILPNQLIYISSISGTQQVILKISNETTSIIATEGMMLNLNDSLCRAVDFEKKQPLVYESIMEADSLEDLKNGLEKANIKSYLGIPISFVNGDRFGTLCAVNDKEKHFDDKSITLLQRIVKMFSYYLDLERIAYRDSLTNLYNRRYLSNFFDDQQETEGWIFFLDLDGFKKVNDVHGHDAGDIVLEDVAVRLQNFVNGHPDALAFRLGGDEFVIHFSRVSDMEEMSRLAEQVLERLTIWDPHYQLSTSIGIAMYPGDCTVSLKTLLKNADYALNQAKASGKNTYKFFEL
ncbi:sensor domain-containing diguanylate cyclase [Planococcus donghaensis]|uniref:GGDEF domain-containing protein n=1 Tax=Planococcus donghaensis TaxID=414778 RepID=A0A1C7EKD2_9BACL|nr:sensor domain-containing diguanylate cyclase [Planococcus donghaensis]ANU24279.1 GGDEF domain-containing protein [Planococcus donghaensis]